MFAICIVPNLFLSCLCPAQPFIHWVENRRVWLSQRGHCHFFHPSFHFAVLCWHTQGARRVSWGTKQLHHAANIYAFICYTIYIHLSFIRSTTIQFRQIFWKGVLILSNQLWMFEKKNSIGLSIVGASYFCHQLTTSKTPSLHKYGWFTNQHPGQEWHLYYQLFGDFAG